MVDYVQTAPVERLGFFYANNFMIIHLLPVRGHEMNTAWAWPHHFYEYEILFVRCRKNGELGKPLHQKTPVYTPIEVIKTMEKTPYRFKIHWKK